MKCEECRRLCAIDPGSLDAEVTQHLESCEACAAHAKELQGLDQMLLDAMQVELPPGLGDRIQELSEERPQPPAKPLWSPMLAMVATVLLVIGLSSGIYQVMVDDVLPPERVVAYLMEQQPDQYQGQLAPDNEVEKMFNSVGASLVGDLGEVNFCRITELEQHPAAYLVLQGDQGPVSVMLIADVQLDGPMPLNSEGMSGHIVSGPKGSMALMGGSGEDLKKLEQRVRQAVRWI